MQMARLWVVTACLVVCFLFATSNILEAADYQTQNFIIRNAPSLELARKFGQTAEDYRKEMALLWLGRELPPWASPCPIAVKVGNYGASGETSMHFQNADRFEFEWDMKIQGSAEAILTAVMPHEITHMVLASHFKEPIPRWIDEGAATFVENEKERQNYRRLLYQYLRTGRGIPFNQMFRMTKYPDDQMPLYSQSFSLAEFLILQQGHQQYVDFAAAGMKTGDWPQAIYEFYGYENLGELQIKWNRWVDAGCPDWMRQSLDEPIFVRGSTQYIASRDFMPSRQPLVLARATRPDMRTVENQGIVPVSASWESTYASNVVTAGVASQPQREPLRLELAQAQSQQLQSPQSQPLFATLSPISESGRVMPSPVSQTVPQAIVAQPVTVQPAARPVNVAPTQMQESAAHMTAMATSELNSQNGQVPSREQFGRFSNNTSYPGAATVKDSRVMSGRNIR